jgi:tungstate transport system ATP-binding protein
VSIDEAIGGELASGRAAGETEKVVLEAAGIRFRAGGVELLDVPAFRLEQGSTHVILGPNGAGKSTFLRVLSGLLRGEGSLVFDGRPVLRAADRLRLRRATGSVFQKSYLLDTSVRGNVESGLRLRGVRGEELARRATAALELLGIGHLAPRPRAGLSGGEAQRVSIARALAVEPRVLFLDEPMVSLDPPTRRALLRDLEEIFAASSMAVAWVTHDREEAVAAGDELSFMRAGRLVQTGSVMEVVGRPATREVADFFGMETFLEGVVAEGDWGACRLVLPGGFTVLCADASPGPAVACVSPEDVVLFREAPPAGSTSLRNLVEGRVLAVEVQGRLRRIQVDCGAVSIQSLVTAAAAEDLGLSPGVSVVAAFKAAAVWVLPRHGRSEEVRDGSQRA